MADIHLVKFEEAEFQGLPEKSVVLKFPKMSITIFNAGGKLYGEILQGKKRQTFRGFGEDSEQEIREAVARVMAKLNQVVTITKMNK